VKTVFDLRLYHTLLKIYMDNSFFTYLQQLELMAFFSGYPLIYAVTLFFTGDRQLRSGFKNRLVSLLPFAYALVGTLYIGLQLKNLYPNYSLANIKLSIQQPWLVGLAMLSVLFWIPAVAKRKSLSLIHSLVFFYFLVKDLTLKLMGYATGNDFIRNDMKIYTISLLLNAGSLLFVLLLSSMLKASSKKGSSLNFL
jgi:hypothetical protein